MRNGGKNMYSLSVGEVKNGRVEINWTHMFGTVEQLKHITEYLGIEMYEIWDADRNEGCNYYASPALIEAKEEAKRKYENDAELCREEARRYNEWLDTRKELTLMSKDNVCIMARPHVNHTYGEIYKGALSYTPILHVNGKEVGMYLLTYISSTGKVMRKKFREQNEVMRYDKDKLKENEIEIALEMLKELTTKLREIEITEPNRVAYKIREEVWGGK
jgi:hypothetical protein